jgi:hypothetical protein
VSIGKIWLYERLCGNKAAVDKEAKAKHETWNHWSKRRLTGRSDSMDRTAASASGAALSDGGARVRFYRAVCEAHLTRIIRVDLKSERFTYDINADALTHARMMDGKLLLVTNVVDLAPDGVVNRYKSLVDIKRGFRVLKSEIEIGPIYHRLPDRIRAHASICFMALRLYRVRLR